MTDEQPPNPKSSEQPPASEAATPAEAPPTAPTPAPAGPPQPAAEPKRAAAAAALWTWGLGRRKTSVARVRIRPGKGEFKINGRDVDDYLYEDRDRHAVRAPLKATHTEPNWDVFVNVKGGGLTGQAGAIMLGIARALKAVDSAHEPVLRDQGYLTRDSRMVERKKYGQRGARRRFQFSKR